MTDGCRECGRSDADVIEPLTKAVNAHLFFEALAKAIQAPHFGEKQRLWTNEMLKRATEAGIYHPGES